VLAKLIWGGYWKKVLVLLVIFGLAQGPGFFQIHGALSNTPIPVTTATSPSVWLSIATTLSWVAGVPILPYMFAKQAYDQTWNTEVSLRIIDNSRRERFLGILAPFVRGWFVIAATMCVTHIAWAWLMGAPFLKPTVPHSGTEVTHT